MGGFADLSIFESIQNNHNESIGYRGNCFAPVKNDFLPNDPMFAGLFGSWMDDVDSAVDEKLDKELSKIPTAQQNPVLTATIKDRITKDVIGKLAKSYIDDASNSKKTGLSLLTTYPDGTSGDKAVNLGDGKFLPYGALKLLVDNSYDRVVGDSEKPLSKSILSEPIFTPEEIIARDIDSQFADERRIAKNSVVGPISTDPHTEFFDYVMSGMKGKVNRVTSPLSGYDSEVDIADKDSLRRIAIETAKELNYGELADFFAHYGQFSQLTDKLYKQASELFTSPQFDRNIAKAYERNDVGKSILDGAESNYSILFPDEAKSGSPNYDVALDYVTEQHDMYGEYLFPDYPDFRNLVGDKKFADMFKKRTGKDVSAIKFDSMPLDKGSVDSDADVAYDYWTSLHDNED